MRLTDIRQITNKIIRTTAKKTTILHTTNLQDIEILGLVKNKNDQFILFYYDCNNETFYNVIFEMIDRSNAKIIDFNYCQSWAFDPLNDFYNYFIDEKYFKIWIEKDGTSEQIDEIIENSDDVTKKTIKKLLQLKEYLKGV